jgi:anti-sigma factor RsiW
MTHYTDRLSAYLDDELPPVERRGVEAHLAGCASCAGELAALRAVIAAAAALPPERPSDSDAWPGIRDRIGASPHARQPWRISLSVPQLAAAATLFVALGMGGMWLQLRPAVNRPAAPAPPAAATVTPAVLADESYTDIVAELEAALADGRDRLEPETIQVLEANLAAIDAAIAQARDALAGDPANVGLTRHLVRTRAMRVTLLRRAVAAAYGTS